MVRGAICLAVFTLVAACTKASSSSQNSRSSSSGTANVPNGSGTHAGSGSTAAVASLDGTWTSPCVDGPQGPQIAQIIFSGQNITTNLSYYGDPTCQSGVSGTFTSVGTWTAQGPNALFPEATNNVTTMKSAAAVVPNSASLQGFQSYIAALQGAPCQSVQLSPGVPVDVTACFTANNPSYVQPNYGFYQVVGNRLYTSADGNNGNDGSTTAKRNDAFDRINYYINSQQPAAAACPTTTNSLAIIGGELTSSYPAVVRIGTLNDAGSTTNIDSCTATFISPTAAITAAHCIPDSGDPTGVVYVPGFMNNLSSDPRTIGTPALQLFGLGVYGNAMLQAIANNDTATQTKDVAIVLFPPGIAPAAMGLSNQPAVSGTPLTLVGYGATSISGQAIVYDGKKRTGSSVSLGFDPNAPDTMLYFGNFAPSAIAAAPIGTMSLIGEGDSGGAVLAGNTLTAVISGSNVYVDQSTQLQNFGVAVTSSNAQGLIAQANAAGAGIPAPGSAPPVITTKPVPWTPPTCQ